jgi:arabinogalactan endo-1,4-beta-galactosidase
MPNFNIHAAGIPRHGTCLLIMIAVAAAMAGTVNGQSLPQFSTGADVSDYGYIQSNGGTYSYDGQQVGLLPALQDAGVNTVRLRLFTNATPGEVQADGALNTMNNLSYTLPLLQKVNQAGFYSVLNMHLSDTWADPGHQAIPAAWSSITALSAMETQLYDYCDTTITTLRQANAMPSMVTIGNEINNGILWPIGQLNGTSAQWEVLAGLLNSAIAGVDAGSGGQNPEIMINYGANSSSTYFFNKLSSLGVKYDVIGYDYYPFYDGALGNLQSQLTSLATVNKPIILAETAYPWTNNGYNSSFSGQPGFDYPFTPAGQAQYAAAVIAEVKALPNGLGRGVWWWGGEYTADQADFANNPWSYRSLFDASGNALPALTTLGQSASSIPEPQSLVLLAAGTAFLFIGGCVRRRNG